MYRTAYGRDIGRDMRDIRIYDEDESCESRGKMGSIKKSGVTYASKRRNNAQCGEKETIERE